MKKLISFCMVVLFAVAFSGCSKTTTTSKTSSAPELEVTGEDPLSTEQITRNDITDPVQAQIQNEQISQGSSFYEANQDVQKKITQRIGREAAFTKVNLKILGKIRIVSERVLQVSNITYTGTCQKTALILTGINDKKASISSVKTYSGEVANDSFYYTLPANVNLLQFGRATLMCIDTNKVIASELFE